LNTVLSLVNFDSDPNLNLFGFGSRSERSRIWIQIGLKYRIRIQKKSFGSPTLLARNHAYFPGREGTDSPWRLSLADMAWACLQQLILPHLPTHVLPLPLSFKSRASTSVSLKSCLLMYRSSSSTYRTVPHWPHDRHKVSKARRCCMKQIGTHRSVSFSQIRNIATSSYKE